MTEELESHEGGTCAVDAAPSDVDAAGKLTLRATARPAPATDLRGRVLVVLDADNEVVAKLPFKAFDGEENRTDDVIVEAPARLGQHLWTGVIPAHATEGGDPLTTRVSFQVIPHRVSTQVWDVPLAISAGETFRVKLGVKCSSACPSAGWAFTIRDHEGRSVAEAVAGHHVWPGTSGLHYAEVELRAPETDGLFKWTVLAKATDDELPHEEGHCTFGVRSVSPPDTLVRVEAVEATSHAPIEGLRVFVHPFSARTGPDGVAELHASKGPRRLVASGKGYIPYAAEFTLEKEVHVRIELDHDVGLSDADVWA